jgi:hypothetical protein
VVVDDVFGFVGCARFSFLSAWPLNIPVKGIMMPHQCFRALDALMVKAGAKVDFSQPQKSSDVLLIVCIKISTHQVLLS